MKNQKVSAQIIQLLVDSFDDELLAVYFFGSWITEYEIKKSDIDIAIICKQKTSHLALWNIAQEIALNVKRNVDLLNLRNATTVMQMQVISKGERRYCTDHNHCEKYENYIFSSYTLLNEERREILQDIKSRGTIYD